LFKERGKIATVCAHTHTLCIFVKGKVLPLHVILHSLAEPAAGKVPTVTFKRDVDLAPESFWEL